MEEKVKERLKKLQALAERGVGGEKATAEKKLQELLKKNGVKSLQELETEETQYYLFSYNGIHKSRLLIQCIYKVLGYENYPKFYRTRGKRQKIGIFCTAAQKIEIELEFEFYSNLFDEEIVNFMDAFISKQNIFPPDAPYQETSREDLTAEELEKMLKRMAYEEGITRRTRAKQIEKKA